jgi:ribosomal protein L11 methyltransferase
LFHFIPVPPISAKNATLWKISVATSPEAEDAMAELLSNLFDEPASVYHDVRTGETTAVAYLLRQSDWSPSRRAAMVSGIERLRSFGLDIGPGRLSVRKIQREDWAESWKRHFKPIIIGSRLLIKPSWSRRQPRPGQVAVVLDPGLSFGTGQHPTTRFCLEQIAAGRTDGKAQSFLDIGTGSGILAIAAAKLGYRPVHALDLDPEAIRVARANARQNGVAGQVRLMRKDLADLPGVPANQYDLVCANLILEILLQEKRRIVNRLKPGGRLVLAGILRRQIAPVRDAYENSGLKLAEQRAEQEWKSASFVCR